MFLLRDPYHGILNSFTELCSFCEQSPLQDPFYKFSLRMVGCVCCQNIRQFSHTQRRAKFPAASVPNRLLSLPSPDFPIVLPLTSLPASPDQRRDKFGPVSLHVGGLKVFRKECWKSEPRE